MINADLKAQIDSQITNDTAVGGITRQEVGGALKAVIDYVDQQDTLVTSSDKTVKITVTESELKSLFTTPKLLLANVTGKVKIIKSWYLHKAAGVAYTNNYGFSIINQAGQNMFASMGNSYMSSSQEFDGVYDFSNSSHGWDSGNQGSSYWIGRSFYLKSDSFDMLTGTGSLDIYINYLEITL